MFKGRGDGAAGELFAFLGGEAVIPGGGDIDGIFDPFAAIDPADNLVGGPVGGYLANQEAAWLDKNLGPSSSRWEGVGERGGRLGAQTAEIVTPAGVESTLGRGALGAVETAGIANISKNSLAYVGDTHVYAIIASDGTTYKIGESAQGAVNGVSRRASVQVQKLIRETGDFYESRILKEFSGKAEARTYETKLIERFRRMFGDDKLPGNKTNR